MVGMLDFADWSTFVAYTSIPLQLLTFLYCNPLPIPMRYRVVVVMFACFILLCGSTHLVMALTEEGLVSSPALLPGIKTATAIVSILTTLALLRLIPEALRFIKHSLALERDILHKALQLREANDLIAQAAALRVQADVLVQMLEAINLVSPASQRQAALGMALACKANTSTIRNVAQSAQAQSSWFSLASPTAGSWFPGASPASPSVSQRAGPQLATRTSSAGATAKVAAADAQDSNADAAQEGLSDTARKERRRGPSLASPSHSRLSRLGSSATQPSLPAQPASGEFAMTVLESEAETDDAAGKEAAEDEAQAAADVAADGPVNFRRSLSVDTEESLASPRSHSRSISRSVVSQTRLVVDHEARWTRYEANILNLLTLAAKNGSASGAEGGSAVTLTAPAGGSGDALLSAFFSKKPMKPSLLELLSHPVCVELLKDEMERLHSVELLLFHLYAVRYSRMQSAKLRRLLGRSIYDIFIAANSELQINISTRQRDAVTAAVKKAGDSGFTPTLFFEAEREVLRLMETNVMKAFTQTAAYRTCGWLISTMDMSRATGRDKAAIKREIEQSNVGD